MEEAVQPLDAGEPPQPLKSGFQSTEFLLSALTVVTGFLVQSGWMTEAVANAWVQLITAAVALAYLCSRHMLKTAHINAEVTTKVEAVKAVAAVEIAKVEKADMVEVQRDGSNWTSKTTEK